jgi:hypothetical protein
METGSNKSLFTLIAVVIFGIFLSLSYWLFQDELVSVLANVLDSTSEMTSIKLDNEGLIPTEERYFTTVSNADGTVAITSYTGTESDIIIPRTINGNSVTRIAPYFHHTYDNSKLKLTSVVIPSSVTSIGVFAFRGNRLTSIVIPSSVTKIENRALELNPTLKSIVTPENVTTLEDAQYYGDGLTTVTISDNVKIIKAHVFGVNAITAITIPEKVESIGDYALKSNMLTKITIPRSVKSLGRAFISDNPNLNEINLPKELKYMIDSNPHILAKTAIYSSTTGIYESTSFYSPSIVHYY